MTRINRREFLALAGTAPIGFAFRKKLPNPKTIKNYPEDLFDPWLEINFKKLAWNVLQIRKRVENRPIMAVIKCNAYGHGLVEIAKFLEKQNIRHFAVAKVQEAMLLRDNGIKSTILNFGPFSRKEAELLVRHNISQSVFSEAVNTLAETARKLNKQAKVHIKVDTGLGRVGVPYYQTLLFIEKVAAMPEIKIEGIFTTFTEEKEFDKLQLKRFLEVCNTAKKKGISTGVRHAASSAAISNFHPSFLDMVRPGNGLYGIEQLPNMDLKPVMSLKTRVIYVKKLRQGDSVSYHRRYVAEKETLLATLPIGYSDRYPPQAVNKAEVLIHGHRWPLIAYISANHSTVDITGSKNIKIGDEVVLFGTQSGNEITIGEVAEWGESSVYKVAIGMNPLLPRVFIEK